MQSYDDIKNKSLLIIDDNKTRVEEFQAFLNKNKHPNFAIVPSQNDLSNDISTYDFYIAESKYFDESSYITLLNFIRIIRAQNDKDLGNILESDESTINQDDIDKMFG